MAAGKTHDQITIYSSVAIAVIFFACFGDRDTALVAAWGNLFGGLWLSPDLDIKSTPWRRWGILRYYWLPYQKFIPHRHYLSHSPVIGTLGRILYLSTPILILAGLLGIGHEVIGFALKHPILIAIGLVGIEFSSVAHLAADGILFGKK